VKLDFNNPVAILFVSVFHKILLIQFNNGPQPGMIFASQGTGDYVWRHF
jgi:hypothetical protein